MTGVATNGPSAKSAKFHIWTSIKPAASVAGMSPCVGSIGASLTNGLVVAVVNP